MPLSAGLVPAGDSPAGGLCLQGGAEFGPRCVPMDTEVLRRAGPGPVVLAPLAAAPGRDYATAAHRGVQWYRTLGAPDVRAAPDVRQDAAAGFAACSAARLLVLPGGSPRRLLAALTGTRAGEALRAVLGGGGVISGASAGAMVLCSLIYLPETGTGAAGLGLVDRSIALPHFRGDLGWARRAGAGPATRILGLPEQSGLWADAAGLTGLGADPVTVRVGRRTHLLGPGDRLGDGPV